MIYAEKLIIYKASAGSGKTFQLTKEYLAILFKNPGSYKNILAVTFTNKATAEMKGRILNELSKIANNQTSPYLHSLKDMLEVSSEFLVSKAKTVLNNILHDYSRFTVETIDNFFQRVLKSFTKELHIYFNYNLELDTPKIIEQAASQMIFSSHQNKELKQWLTDFALEKISQGKTWNAKKDIISLGSELFNEQFQLTFKKLDDSSDNKEVLKEYISSCKKVIGEFEDNLSKIGEKALKVISSSGLSVDDFTQKSKGVAGYFEKLAKKKDSEPNSYVLKASIYFEDWVPKKSQNREQIQQLYNDSLCHLLDSALQYREKNYTQYASANEILKLVYAFGILTDLYSHVRKITNEQNIFLLADTGKLIHTIIENNDAPFIYEKLGNIYTHFMIDEFQDTSELQWKNFFPLIQNSLATGKKNIVVGDVKQAIYRWRNSNWNILGSKIYNQIIKEQLETVSLDKNWRSFKNIVFFNNSLYSLVAKYLQEVYNSSVEDFLETNPFSTTVLSAYNELKQELPGNTDRDKGYVNIKLLDNENWEEQILEELTEIVIELLKKGYNQSQIAFLVRNKTEGQLVVNTLIDNSDKIFKDTGVKPNFLSSDALLLKSSKTIRIIISTLKYIIAPDDEVNKASLRMFVNAIQNEGSCCKLHIQKEDSELFSWLSFFNNEAKQYSLYDLASKIIKEFKLEQLNEKAFLVAFLDTVLDFSRNHHVGIKSFLDWWEENRDSLSLNMEEAENAIQVLTIHKSKGLEFDAVIIPFCNWRIDQHVSHANIMWCTPLEEPFNSLPVVPLTYSKNLSHTYFKEEYALEKLNTYIDNLNLLYVATTRAKQALIIRSPHPEQINRKGLTCSTLLFNALTNSNELEGNDLISIPDYYKDEECKFEVGSLLQQEQSFANKKIGDEISLSGSPFELNKKLHIKYNYKDYFSDEVKISMLNEGKLLHKIFEKILCSEDVANSIEEVYMDGLIALVEKESLTNTVTKLLSSAEAKDWFDKKWQVKTETEILLPGAQQKRPDRVLFGQDKVIVIDYKFGLLQSNKHLEQVEEYVKMIKEMNYSIVEGYVWYVLQNIIKKI